MVRIPISSFTINWNILQGSLTTYCFCELIELVRIQFLASVTKELGWSDWIFLQFKENQVHLSPERIRNSAKWLTNVVNLSHVDSDSQISDNCDFQAFSVFLVWQKKMVWSIFFMNLYICQLATPWDWDHQPPSMGFPPGKRILRAISF